MQCNVPHSIQKLVFPVAELRLFLAWLEYTPKVGLKKKDYKPFLRDIQGNVTVAMPVLNEEKVIVEVINEWLDVVRKLPKGSLILIEDGGSKDNTVNLIESHPAYESSLFLIKKNKPEGFGSAAKSLMRSCHTEYFFFTDSDGQYVAKDFWKLWKHAADFDVVRGIKLGRQDPLMRRIMSFFWNKLVRFFFEVDLSDINSAFFIIRNDRLIVQVPKLIQLPTMVVSELMLKCKLDNYEIKNIYIRHRERMHGISRGVPFFKIPLIIFKQTKGLLLIKEEMRVRNIH